MTPSRPPGAGPANSGRLTDVCQIFVRFQGGGRWRSAEHQPSAGRFFFARVSASTLIFLGNDIRRNTLIVCDPEATPYKYLASIRIRATAATTPKPGTQSGPGRGCLVFASLRLSCWAARRDEVPPSPGLMHAKVWPRTDL